MDMTNWYCIGECNPLVGFEDRLRSRSRKLNLIARRVRENLKRTCSVQYLDGRRPGDDDLLHMGSLRAVDFRAVIYDGKTCQTDLPVNGRL